MVITSMPGRQRALLAIGLILMAWLTVIEARAAAPYLSDYTWEKRPLLLFARSQNDTRLQQTVQALSQRQCDLEDRDMIIGIIVEQGQSRLNNQPITTSRATELRDRYQIDPGQFSVILIGKDGGEKERIHTVPDLDSIFALIDGMPMRQDEMMENPADCDK